MTKICSICGNQNDECLTFCESCGSPLEITEEKKKVPEIEFGFASNLNEDEESKDAFFVTDAKSLFGEYKQRKILFVLAKGFGRIVDVKSLAEKLLEEILNNSGDFEYESRLQEIRNQIENDTDSLFSDEESEKLEMGLLIGIVNNANVNVLCLNDARVIALKHDENDLGIDENPSDESVISLTLENGNYVLMCDKELMDEVNKDDLIDTISKANNVQSACDKIVSMGKEIDSDGYFSLILIRRTD